MRKPYVIVLYLRISVEDGDNHENGKDESNSVSNQRDLLLDYVKSLDEFADCQIIELCDDGYSGTNFERPAVKKLLHKAKAKEINCVIVKDFSRFGRDYLTVSDYVDQIFPFLGIRFISINDNYDSAKCFGATSGVEIAFRNVIYSYYSQDISQKVKTGKRTKALNGEFLSPFAPIGYKKDKNDKNKLVIDEPTAQVVRRIFNMAIMGISTPKIARILNAEKVPTPSQIKNKQGYHHPWWEGVGGTKIWDAGTILCILRDERYLGKVVYGRRYRPTVGNYKTLQTAKSDWIVIPDKHDPIVSLEEFEAAQNSVGIYAGTGATVRQTHLFTDKLRCGECRRSLVRQKNPTPRFICETRFCVEDSKCMEGHIKENEIAEVILAAIKAYCRVFLDKQVLAEQATQNNELAILKKQLVVYQTACNKFEEQRAELYDFKADGKISREQYLERQKELSEQQSDMERQFEKVMVQITEQERQLSIEKPKECELRQCLKATTLTRKMVLAFVDCIYVYSDKSIHVKWRFDESEGQG